MGLGAGRGAPRSVRGGHSARYESRRLQRGSERAWAPGWSDATAAAMLETLEAAAHEATGCKQLKKAKVMGVLASTEGTRLLISCSCEDLVPADRQLVADIVQKYHGMVAGCIAAGDTKRALQRRRRF